MIVTVAIGSRANFGSLRGVLLALRRRGATVRPVLFATALSEAYGDVRGSLKRDGFEPFACLSTHIEGDVTDMARVAGLSAMEWSTHLRNYVQDAVLVCGDRHEVLGAAMAAAYANVRLVHTMGGEQTGSIDDRVRDAITALADVHCVATEGAGARVKQLVRPTTDAWISSRADFTVSSSAQWVEGPPPMHVKPWGNIHVTGCPRIDTAREVLTKPDRAYADMLMVSQHPVTTRTWHENHDDMAATLAAVERVATDRNLAVELFWPNGDAGTGGTHTAIREWLRSATAERLTVRTHRAMGPEDYMRMMAATRCLVGNSSSGLREGAWIGTPCVDIGDRQNGRERTENVWWAPAQRRDAIEMNINTQLTRGPYPASTLYGDGTAGEKVAEVILGEP